MAEHRMFAFLHGLSETLPQAGTQAGLYEFILKGVAQVVQAKTGILYLVEETGKSLIPKAILPGCPALFDVPSELAEPSALQSHLMLRNLPVDRSTVVGRCISERQWIHQNDIWKLPEFTVKPRDVAPLSGMLAPLYSGDNPIGVLVLLGDLEDFSVNDFAVFRSLADQSSLALGMVILSRQTSSQKQWERELENARAIQGILLPSKAPNFPGFELEGLNKPARIVSGDYFDFIPLSENRLAVAIADVSGKGVPASLIMAMGRSILRSAAQREASPTLALSAVNRQLFPDIRQDMFVSMALVELRPDDTEVILSRAGHDPPLLYHSLSGEIELIKPPGLALGIDGGSVFDRVTRDYALRMESGDVLLLYTDGLNEALNSQGEEFGMDRVREAFRESASGSAKNILEHIANQAKAFIGSQQLSDDMTLVVLKKL